MDASQSTRKLSNGGVPSAAVFAVCLAVIQVVIDWLTWIELNEAIVYTLPLVLAGMARSRRLLWGMTIFLICTTFAVYTAQIGPGSFSFREPFFINRVLAAVTMLVTAGLLHAWMSAVETLNVRNAQLDSANRELVRRREEITTQNEELNRRREVAEEANNRKTRLLTSVSHDMRSPLHAMNLTAELIRRTADDYHATAEITELAQLLQTNALGLADLVSDILDIASIESGRVELHKSEFALDEFLVDQCRRLAPLAQAKHLTLDCEPMAEPTSIRTDRVKLARIVTNLVSNAIKFTETGGVALTAKVTDGTVTIRVRDTGIGIAAENLDRVFDEFSQLHRPQADRVKGWGLGLAICRRLIDLLGGAIAVESELGRGTTFNVHLRSDSVAVKPTNPRPCVGIGSNFDSGPCGPGLN
jgi:signal transduction histidine kinase